MKEKFAVITGVSKGLGEIFAAKFASEGFRVIGISRSRPKIKVDLWIQADLTDPKARQEMLRQVQDYCNGIDILFNNAGMGVYETWEKLSSSELRKLFELNFFSMVETTQLFMGLLRSSQGTIINTSSIAGELYVPCMGAYCASKAAVTMFSDSLRAELKPQSIHVLNLIIGRFDTGFSSRSFGSKTPPSSPGGGGDVHKLADKVFKAYQKKKRRLICPAWYKYAVWLSKLFPNFYDKENRKRWGI